MKILSQILYTDYDKGRPKSCPPQHGSTGAAGWDLKASEDIELEPYIPMLIPTNLRIKIPEDHMLLILPRSGNALKRDVIIPNSPGLIDEDYEGHVQIMMTWLAPPTAWRWLFPKKLQIKRGDKVAQAILTSYEQQNWSHVQELEAVSMRGESGFGSTGLVGDKKKDKR